MKKLFSLGVALTVGLTSFAQTFSRLDSPQYSWESATVPNSLGMGTVYFTDYNNDDLLDALISGRCYGGNWSCGFFRITGSTDGLTLNESMITKIDDWHTAARPIDFNSDGYIDYVITGEMGWQLFKNNAGTFEKVEFANADKYIRTNYSDDHKEMFYSQLLSVADMNNDGYQDIITFIHENRNVVVLQSNGDGTFTEVTCDAFGSLGGSSSLTVGDINNDGYVDIILSGWGSNGVTGHGTGIRVILNNGDGTYTGKMQTAFGGEKTTVFLSDANGDGLLDLFFSGETCYKKEGEENANWNSGIYVSLNTGNTDDNFTVVTPILEGVAKRGGIEVVDLDADGDLDLIFAGDELSNLGIYLNDGAGNYTAMENNNIPQFRGGVTISAADYDKDGAVDFAIMGYSDQPFVIYHNDGTGKYTAPATPTHLKYSAQTDGVKFNWNAVNGATRYNLYVKLTDGTTLTTIPANVSNGFLRVADINGAITSTSYILKGITLDEIESWGVQAINASKATGAFATYTQFVSIDMPTIEQDGAKLPTSLGMGTVYFMDYNNDNYLDVVGAGRSYSNWGNAQRFCLTGSESGFTLNENGIVKIDDYHAALRPIDYNNDGYIDLVMAGEYSWRLFKNNAGTFEEVTFANADKYARTAQEKFYAQILAVADMNNDGYQDIVTFLNDGRNVVVLQNNNGDGTFTEVTHDAFGAMGGNSSLTVGDVNNDGYIDIVVNGWGGTGVNGTGVKVIYNNGDGSYTAYIQGVYGTEDHSVVALGDANGDGLLDLFFSGKYCYDKNGDGGGDWDAGMFMSFNTGNTEANFTEVIALIDGDWKMENGGFELVDLDSDGDLDLICGGNGLGKIAMFLNDGQGTYTETESSLVEHRGCPSIQAADYDQDGAMDFVALGYSDQPFKIYHNQEAKSIEAPAPPQNVKMEYADGTLQATWDASEGAVRYNLYMEKKDGTIITNIPADFTTGFLRSSYLSAAPTATHYTFKGINPDEFKNWGVQAINAGKYASAFAVASLPSAIDGVATEQVYITVNNGQIYVNVDANVAVYDVVGRLYASQAVNAGEAVNALLATGNVYVVKATTQNGTYTQKVVL